MMVGSFERKEGVWGRAYVCGEHDGALRDERAYYFLVV